MDRQATRRLDDLSAVVMNLKGRVEALEKAAPCCTPQAEPEKPTKATFALNEAKLAQAAEKARLQGPPPGSGSYDAYMEVPPEAQKAYEKDPEMFHDGNPDEQDKVEG